MRTTKQMELKAWRRLAELRGMALGQIIHRALTEVQYSKDKPERLFEKMGYFANPESWNYDGIMSDIEQAEMRLLEFLLDDERNEIGKTVRDWRPRKES